MKTPTIVLAAGLSLAASGACAQTRTVLVHFDGSCMGMTLKIYNYHNINAESVGCGDTKRAYIGTIQPGDKASITSTNEAQDLVKLNYVIGLKNQTWVLYETLDGKTEEIGNGFWTKRGPVVTVEDMNGKKPDEPGAK